MRVISKYRLYIGQRVCIIPTLKYRHTCYTAGVFFACITDHIRYYVVRGFIVLGSQRACDVTNARRQLIQAATRLHSAGGSTQRLRRVVLLYETL